MRDEKTTEVPNWASTLNPGDKAMVPTGQPWGLPPYRLLTVVRCTGKMIVTKDDAGGLEFRFWRENGRPVSGGGFKKIEPVTEDASRAVRALYLRQWLHRIGSEEYRRKEIGLQTLEAMKRAYDAQAGGANGDGNG